MKSKYDKKDNTYERMLKERGIDIKPEIGIQYSRIRVKNSEDWHKFRKAGDEDKLSS